MASGKKSYQKRFNMFSSEFGRNTGLQNDCADKKLSQSGTNLQVSPGEVTVVPVPKTGATPNAQVLAADCEGPHTGAYVADPSFSLINTHVNVVPLGDTHLKFAVTTSSVLPPQSKAT